MALRSDMQLRAAAQDLLRNPAQGIRLNPDVGQNFYSWKVILSGPNQSIWAEALLRARIDFDEDFNRTPPKLCFQTVPFHPNVNAQTGLFSSTFEWSSRSTIRDYLEHVRICFEAPDFAVPSENPDAAELYRNHPEVYRQVVKRCCDASQRLASAQPRDSPASAADLGVDKLDLSYVHDSYTTDSAGRNLSSGVSPSGSKPPPKKKATPVSFLDYFTLWHGIASTKANMASRNEYVDSVKTEKALQKVHFGSSYAEFEAQHRAKLVSEVSTMYYGKPNAGAKKDDGKAKAASKSSSTSGYTNKLDKLTRMKKLYLQRSDREVKNLPDITARSTTRSHMGAMSSTSTNALMHAPLTTPATLVHMHSQSTMMNGGASTTQLEFDRTRDITRVIDSATTNKSHRDKSRASSTASSLRSSAMQRVVAVQFADEASDNEHFDVVDGKLETEDSLMDDALVQWSQQLNDEELG